MANELSDLEIMQRMCQEDKQRHLDCLHHKPGTHGPSWRCMGCPITPCMFYKPDEGPMEWNKEDMDRIGKAIQQWRETHKDET